MRVTLAYLERLIRDYQSAYEAANGKQAPDISWSSGWFTMHSDGYNTKLRRQKLEAMRDALRARALTPGSPMREGS